MRHLCVLLVLCAPFGAAVAGDGDREAGVVVTSVGQWQLRIGDTTSPVSGGQRLPAGAVATCTTQCGDLTVLVYGGGLVSCTPGQECRFDEDSGDAEGPLDRIGHAIEALVRGPDRARYTSTVARGAASTHHEAVLDLQGRRLNLVPLLCGLPGGPYQVSLAAYDGAGALLSAMAAIDVDWTGCASSPVRVPKLASGVYRVHVEPRGGGASAFDTHVLVAEHARYPAAEHSFAEVRAALDAADVPAGPGTDSLLHVTLVAIAQGALGESP